MDNSKDEAVRKLLLYVLRHGANKWDLEIDAEGYVPVDKLLEKREFQRKGCSFQQIQRVVDNNSQQQFTLKRLNEDKWMIRATFGHTLVKVDKLDIGQEISAGDFAFIIHAAFKGVMDQVKTGGLKRDRNHIIFNSIEKIDKEFLERFDFMIYIDINRCIQDGINFFKTENFMILTNSDFIDAKYFLKIVDCKSENINLSIN